MKHISELRLADLYRSRRGWVLGVCKGLATFLDVPVFWVRLLVLLLTPCTGVWPMVGGYLLAAFLIRPEPALAPDNDEERDFYDAYVSSRPQTLQRLRAVATGWPGGSAGWKTGSPPARPRPRAAAGPRARGERAGGRKPPAAKGLRPLDSRFGGSRRFGRLADAATVADPAGYHRPGIICSQLSGRYCRKSLPTCQAW